jgi:ArsR family transcriptional regulator
MAVEAESILSESPSFEDLTPFCKALCSLARTRIVELLLHGEYCVGEITALIDVSQRMASYHLAILHESGFVAMREEGVRSYYRIDEEHLIDALQAVSDALTRAREKQAERRPDDRCVTCCESVQSKGRRRHEPRLRGRGTGDPERARPSR